MTRGPIPTLTHNSGHHQENPKQCVGMRPLFPDDPAAEGNCTRKMDTCQRGHNASICSAELRTYNTAAECHGPEDWYEFSPWRAPGASPVFDSCGVAGGKPPPRGGYGAQYYNTTFASQGDHGSKVLKPRPTGVTWKAGSAVEVSWGESPRPSSSHLASLYLTVQIYMYVYTPLRQKSLAGIEANHGGGYQVSASCLSEVPPTH